VSGEVHKFKCPLKKTQPFCPGSRDLNWTGKGLSYIFFILITMAHHERSIRERVIALAEKGGLSASAASESGIVSFMSAVSLLQSK
jgi:hypothetical protein